jgi:anti-anti-sigma factor
MEPLIVESEERAEGIIIHIRGEVRLDTKAMEAAFLRAVASHPKAVVLDLGGMTFISSLGMGSIVSLRNGVRRGGGKLIACGTRPLVMDAFKRARLNEIFTVACESLDEALAAAGNS